MNTTPRIMIASGLMLSLSTAAWASNADVRVIHASPDAPAVDVLVNDGIAFENIAFTGVTGYASLPADTYNVKVVPTGETEPVVIEADLALESSTTYSVLAVNTLANIEPLVLIDDNTLSPDNARVRFVHASPNAPAVDIAVADGGPVLFANIEFKGVGDYIEVPAGTYDLEARLAGTETVVLDIPGVALTENRVYTAYAMGFAFPRKAKGAEPLQAVLSVDNEAKSNVRVVHASPDAPNVDVLVNDGVAFADLPFTGVTDYASLGFGTYNVKVVPAGETEPVVIEADLGLLANTDYTVLAVNTLANIEPLVLVDDNATSMDNARLRFVHASPNAPAVDIALADGGAVLFGNIEFKGVGDYIEVPGGTYDLEARLAGTETVVLDIPGVMVENERVYTAYAMGLVNGEPALQAVLSLDFVGCSADINGDGAVETHDLLLLLGAWGSDDSTADLDGDGNVGTADLLLLLGKWGECPTE
ncbi:MAG: DUF4397 domain-containing protein [Planctomycetota bacterium]|nr:DUF4397 domain-containing protein [Planctomycetota bacterium]